MKLNENWNPNRYALIKEKHAREIVMLRGTGCNWKKCRFCDYYLDYDKDTQKNQSLNIDVLENVTGEFGILEIINSGSFIELDILTKDAVIKKCTQKSITKVEIEMHWMYKDLIKELKQKFKEYGLELSVKTGIETFDYLFRECYLDKGINETNPKEISKYFDDCCLLFGLPGQTYESMEADILLANQYFNRICINIMQENQTKIKPSPEVIKIFMKRIYPDIKDYRHIDILLENTAFGIGGVTA